MRRLTIPFLALIIITLLKTLNTEAQSYNVIDVTDYNILPGTKKSITYKINKLIEGLKDEPVTINFPKGRYDFYPDTNYYKTYFESNTYDVNPKRLAILLKKKKNIVINGNGSDFVYHGHIQPLTLDNSENIEIKNINIDWEQPLTAESEVIEADSTHILLKIDKTQFPYKVHKKGVTFAAYDWEASWTLSAGSWLIEIDKKHLIPAQTGAHGCVTGDLKNVIYSEKKPGYILMEGNFTKTPAVGNHLIMRHSTRDHAGMFIFHSKDIKLENINVFHTSGLGILSQYSENITMNKVNMIPNPKKNRYLSGHDDGLHFMGCKGKIVVDDCDAQGLMDDAINIHGTYVPIKERVDDKTLKCSYSHSMSMGLIWAQKGDTIHFVKKKNMKTIGKGVVKKYAQLDSLHFIIAFNSNISKEVSADFSLENISWTPDVKITNCYVGSNRARGYLISTPGKVIIENNIFESSGSAILIAGDANYWYESGAVKDVVIRNNKFKASCNSSMYQFCNAIISIYPEIPDVDPSRPYHKNIIIKNNSFNPSDYPIVYAKSVNGLVFTNNNIKRSYDYKAWHPHKYNFYLEACKNVEITENYIDKDVLGKNILIKNMSKKELMLSNSALELSY